MEEVSKSIPADFLKALNLPPKAEPAAQVISHLSVADLQAAISRRVQALNFDQLISESVQHVLDHQRGRV